ncbi:MAG: MliC family protein [Thermovirgaceae bacterium]|nr:MliC family protein [Thermovirgaceae bacterium]
MRKMICFLMIALSLLLQAGSLPVFAADQPGSNIFKYDFFGLRFEVRFVEGGAILYLPDGPLELPQAVSGSGARFTDGETTFWIKGDNACMEINGSVVEDPSE